MTALSFADLERYWTQAGGPPAQAQTAAAVAEAESGGAPRSTGELNNDPFTGDYSVGPWQINYYGALSASRTKQFGSADTLESNPLADAQAAVAISKHGTDFSPWTTYSDNAYLGYLPGGPTTAGTPSGGPASAAATPSSSSSGGVVPSLQELVLRLAELAGAVLLAWLAIKQFTRIAL